MSVSGYFTDDDLEQQLRVHFNSDEQFDINFRSFFSQIIDRGNDLYLEIRGRKFSINKITGVVTEVE